MKDGIGRLPLQQVVKSAVFSALGVAGRVMQPEVPALAEVRSFLLLQHAAALGTAVHCTPLVAALRAAVPDAEIVVHASGFSLEVFRGNPAVDRLVATPNPVRGVIAAARAMRGALPVRRPFATITALGGERSAFGLAALLAGAGNRVGFTLTPELYHAPLRFDPARSQIANNLRIVEALGYQTPNKVEPQMFFTEADLEYARRLVAQLAEPSRPLAVLVTQTSPTQRKGWRAERFTAVADALITERGFNVVLVGSAAERERVEGLREAIGQRAINVAGETSLPQLAALLSLCRVGVTLDTGTLHIGRAVGLAMVIIAPAWSPVIEWLPVGDARYIILKNLDMASAPAEYLIDEVQVDEVLGGLEQLLRAPVGEA